MGNGNVCKRSWELPKTMWYYFICHFGSSSVIEKALCGKRLIFSFKLNCHLLLPGMIFLLVAWPPTKTLARSFPARKGRNWSLRGRRQRRSGAAKTGIIAGARKRPTWLTTSRCLTSCTEMIFLSCHLIFWTQIDFCSTFGLYWLLLFVCLWWAMNF